MPDAASVVVYAARFDEMKNPDLFFRAVAAHAEIAPDTHYIVCGAGMTTGNAGLQALLARVGDARVHALGIRDDMPAIYRAADVVALTSAYGEAAPLCLLEGAASGAVPVTTDVGDAARLIAGFGIVTGRDPHEIATAWQRACAERGRFAPALRAARPGLGRDRMVREYGAVIDAQRRTLRLAA
ncbi:glycosyltransferase [Microbacterium sp. NM3R9]|uniref:glycosyltransferase n=1 Tax=Microbacterium thalli TaxID=3027921 RepID=UPI002653067C|nr:glycosyltransferase [Microbacterium thalli]MDN8549918.1 glycosyltransferase [Microbacterium thalli]